VCQLGINAAAKRKRGGRVPRPCIQSTKSRISTSLMANVVDLSGSSPTFVPGVDIGSMP
jgi:hypothetical protein